MKKAFLLLPFLLLIQLLAAQNSFFLPFSLNADSVRLVLTSNPEVESMYFLPGKIVVLDQHQAKIEYSFHRDKLYRIQFTRRYPSQQSDKVFNSVFNYFAMMRYQSKMTCKEAQKLGTCFYRPGEDLVGVLRQTETHSDQEITLELHKLANCPVPVWQEEDYYVGINAMPIGAILRGQSPIHQVNHQAMYPGINTNPMVIARVQPPIYRPSLSFLFR